MLSETKKGKETRIQWSELLIFVRRVVYWDGRNTYLIQYAGELYAYLCKINQRGFAYEKGLFGEIGNTYHNIIKILKRLIKGDIFWLNSN